MSVCLCVCKCVSAGFSAVDKTAKHNVLEFSGFVAWSAEDADTFKVKADTYSADELKDICNLCGVHCSGAKVEKIERLLSFFEKPSESKSVSSSVKKGKKSKKGKKAAGGAKRTPSSYILYCNDHREKVTKANPGTVDNGCVVVVVVVAAASAVSTAFFYFIYIFLNVLFSQNWMCVNHVYVRIQM